MKLWGIMLVLALMLAIGCRPTPAPFTPVSPTATPTVDMNRVGPPNSLEAIKAIVGQEFRISLETNASTGYLWELAKPLDESILKLVKFESQPPPETTPRVIGAPGMHTWTFKAVGKGQTEVFFKYARPWEKDTPPAKTATYRVVVEEKNASFGQTSEQPTAGGRYLFIEEWVEIYKSPMSLPPLHSSAYWFEEGTGWLRPFIVPPGKWLTPEELPQLKLVYGTGQSRIGSLAAGAASQILFIPSLRFSTGTFSVEYVDSEGTVDLIVDGEKAVLRPGESWRKDLRRTLEGRGIMGVGDELSRHRITNYGFQDKSKIQLVK